MPHVTERVYHSTLDIDTLCPHFDSSTEQINQNFMIETKKMNKKGNQINCIYFAPVFFYDDGAGKNTISFIRQKYRTFAHDFRENVQRKR